MGGGCRGRSERLKKKKLEKDDIFRGGIKKLKTVDLSRHN